MESLCNKAGLFGKTYLFQIFASEDVVFSDASNVSYLDSIVLDYSHQFSSLVLAVDKDLSSTRLYLDYIVWLFKPLKLLGVNVPDSISYYNTYVATGSWDSEIPPGFVALNFYQGGVIGVVISTLGAGFLVKLIDELIWNTYKLNSSNFSKAFSCIIFLYMPFLFFNSDIALFLQWSFVYILLLITLMFFRKFKLRKIL